jgi:nucleoid DNA-binding protein
MSLGKKGIAKNITTKTHLSYEISSQLINSFLKLIISNINNHDIKISNFGVFNMKVSPKRIGRNPKTKKEYTIPKKNKASFKASNRIKSIIN